MQMPDLNAYNMFQTGRYDFNVNFQYFLFIYYSQIIQPYARHPPQVARAAAAFSSPTVASAMPGLVEQLFICIKSTF